MYFINSSLFESVTDLHFPISHRVIAKFRLIFENLKSDISVSLIIEGNNSREETIQENMVCELRSYD